MTGRGGLLQSNRLRGDLSLVATAVRKRWPISDKVKAELLARLGRIVEEGSTEDALRAIKLLLEMEGQNQRDDLRELAGDRRVDLNRIAEDLGISF